jgi:glycosyltransferase involved in cell wall biosynthesis
VELHHRLGQPPDVLDLCRRLDVPYEVHVHDYAAFCPRIALLGPARRYCGEPDLAGCEACIAVAGSELEEPIGPGALIARSTADFAGAARVIVPSRDVARRLVRHFPALRPRVRAWEREPPAPPPPAAGAALVCIAGAIGLEKGFEVLLACAQDAARRALPLRFVLVGYSIDDAALLRTGRVFVTGPYREAEAVALIARQGARLALLPSIWPETWCFALSALWRAGLFVAAFDIGTPAERIRARGGGLLLPLGLDAPLVNARLLEV